MDMVGAPTESPSRDNRQLEVKNFARSGLLTRARGLLDSNVMMDSRSSNDGGGDKNEWRGCRL
eukprot:4288547-Pleurochrysis_carterae.AAC.3